MKCSNQFCCGAPVVLVDLSAAPGFTYFHPTLRRKPRQKKRPRWDKPPEVVPAGRPMPLIERYTRRQDPLKFMETARHRQGYGAARKQFQRFMDRQGYVNRDCRNESDWKLTAPHRRVIYPPSLFKGRGKEREERQCQACDKKFLAKRKDAVYCSATCRKWASRHG